MKKIFCLLIVFLSVTSVYAKLRPEVSASFKLLSLEMKGYFFGNAGNLPEVSSGFLNFAGPSRSRDISSGRSVAPQRVEDCSSSVVTAMPKRPKNTSISLGSGSQRNMMGLVVGIGLNFAGSKGYYSYEYSWGYSASHLKVFYFYIGFADKFLFDDVNGIMGEITYGWDLNYSGKQGNWGMLAINARYLRRLTSHSSVMGGVEMNLLMGGKKKPFVVSPTVAYSYMF